MATAELKAITVTRVTLTLDTEEAGYLLDLLLHHVAGHLTSDDEPLGSIRVALETSGVERRRAWNVNTDDESGGFKRRHAVLNR